MPTFSAKGNDEYICQKCVRILDSVDFPPEWRPDITGHLHAGNACPSCVREHGLELGCKASVINPQDNSEHFGRVVRTSDLVVVIRWQSGKTGSFTREQLLSHKIKRVKEPGPISLHEHCHQESGGLTGVDLERYINRHYGHN